MFLKSHNIIIVYGRKEFIIYVHHISFTHSFTDEYLGEFYNFYTMNGVEMNASMCFNGATEP